MSFMADHPESLHRRENVFPTDAAPSAAAGDRSPSGCRPSMRTVDAEAAARLVGVVGMLANDWHCNRCSSSAAARTKRPTSENMVETGP